MVTSADPWFVVLPDLAVAPVVADDIEPRAELWARHASGRPWLLVKGGRQDVVIAEVPRGSLAVIGDCPVTAGELARHGKDLTGLADLDRIARALPGCFHLLATVDGQVSVRGSVSGLRRVSYGQLAQLTFATDRADVVASLTGAQLDPQKLALWLMCPGRPAPLLDVSPWRGVRNLPPDACLHLDRKGGAEERTWWQPPEPTLGLAEGAARLAETLTAVVAGYAKPGSEIGADLSGGLDSTTLCFLAARNGAHVSAITYTGADAANGDRTWATQAATELAGLDGFTHQVLETEELPPSFQALWAPGEPLDEPFPGLRDAAWFDLRVRAAAKGGAYHLSGHGADEVLSAMPAALHTIVRRRPLTGLAQARGLRSLRHWPLRPVLRGLADGRSYPRWLADATTELGAFTSARDTSLSFAWDGPFRVPPWVSPAATDTIRRQLAAAVPEARPLARTRGQHAALLWLWRGSGRYRQVRRFLDRTGTRVVWPFLDDRVIDTCLSVRLDERASPFRYKPLLTEAVRGVVPETALARSTKGHTARDLFGGLRKFRPELTELLDDPLVGRLGLVDVDALRAAFLGMYPPTVPIVVAEATLACEVWLRGVTAPVALTGKGN